MTKSLPVVYNDLWKEQSRYNIRSIYYLQQRTNVTQHVPHRFLFKSFITQFTKHCSFARRKISLINGLHLELVLTFVEFRTVRAKQNMREILKDKEIPDPS